MRKSAIRVGDRVMWRRTTEEGSTELIPATVTGMHQVFIRIDAEGVGVCYVGPQSLIPWDW